MRTPGPWKVYDQSVDDGPEYQCLIQSETDAASDWIAQEVTRDNAAFIVLACNAHERLVEALRDAMNYWTPACPGGDCDKGYHNEEFHRLEKARAVLAEMGEG